MRETHERAGDGSLQRGARADRYDQSEYQALRALSARKVHDVHDPEHREREYPTKPGVPKSRDEQLCWAEILTQALRADEAHSSTALTTRSPGAAIRSVPPCVNQRPWARACQDMAPRTATLSGGWTGQKSSLHCRGFRIHHLSDSDLEKGGGVDGDREHPSGDWTKPHGMTNTRKEPRECE